MLQASLIISTEEHRLLALHVASSKTIADQIAGRLKEKLPEEELLVQRADEVRAALQRLEWQLERSLGKLDD